MGSGIRDCFIPRDGWVFCSIDYGALEMVTLAQTLFWKYGPNAMQAAINRGDDLHCRLVAEMLGKSYEEVFKNKKDPYIKNVRQGAKCFHPDVEILTRNGWVKVSALTGGEEVAAVRPKSVDKIEVIWERPTRLTHRQADGLVRLDNEGIDLRVTPDHGMLGFDAKGEPVDCLPSTLGTKRNWVNAGRWAGGEREVDERLLRLAVCTQADGSYDDAGHIRFGFTKERKIRRLLEMVSNDEVKTAREYDPQNEKHGHVYSLTLAAGISARIKELLATDKTMPWWWVELTPALREAVLAEARFWDGSTPRKGKAYGYSSSDRSNHDVLQAIASVTGRKTRTRLSSRGNGKKRDNYKTTVRLGHKTRGENLRVTPIDYNGEVFCLTTTTGYVLVRDGGVPVVVHNCGNFGFGGGMGPVKFVVAKRKDKSSEFPNGIRFCELLGKQARCGDTPYEVEFKGNKQPPHCPVCRDCAIEIKAAYLKAWPEMVQFFRDCSSETAGPDGGWVTIPGTNVVRGPLVYTSYANAHFQGPAAVGAKRALWKVTQESYVVKESPLYRVCRPVAFVHDEIFSEIWEPNLHEAAMRKTQIMVEEMQKVCPDVKVTAEPAAARRWFKDMQAVFNKEGRLVPWEPSKKAA